jgi:hypothetical protein
MRGSTFHKLAVVWLALWFGVIVPGHKRGLVLLPGGEPPVQTKPASAETCPLAGVMVGTTRGCCPGSSVPVSPTAPGSPDGPSKMPVTHCAICYLAGVLDVPPAPDFAPKPLELLEILPWPAPVAVDPQPSLQTYLGRAPPVA